MKHFFAKIRNFFDNLFYGPAKKQHKKTVPLYIKMEEVYEAFIPKKAHPSDAGFDLRAAIQQPVIIPPGECRLIPTGFSCALPEGYELQIRPRSGLALKRYIGVLNSPGTVDCNYRGPVGVILFNFGKLQYAVQPGDRIAQGVVSALPDVEITKVEDLGITDRGIGGFGSTGKA